VARVLGRVLEVRSCHTGCEDVKADGVLPQRSYLRKIQPLEWGSPRSFG
jgi:hypothetical protein